LLTSEVDRKGGTTRQKQKKKTEGKNPIDGRVGKEKGCAGKRWAESDRALAAHAETEKGLELG
jgi:hypothetical protein